MTIWRINNEKARVRSVRYLFSLSLDMELKLLDQKLSRPIKEMFLSAFFDAIEAHRLTFLDDPSVQVRTNKSGDMVI